MKKNELLEKHFYLTASQIKKLSKLAREKSLSESAIVRLLIDEASK